MRPISLSLLVLSGVLLAQGVQAQTTTALSRLLPGGQPVAADRDVIRQQRIEIPEAAIIRDSAASRLLRLNLFSDVSVDAAREYIQPTANGMSWVGRLVGYPTSTVVLVTVGDELVGHIYAPFGFFRIERDASGSYVVQQVDSSLEPGGSDAAETPVGPEVVAPATDTSQRRADDGSVVDVMVVYTRDWLTASGSGTRAEAMVDLLVAETNEALRASSIRLRIRLVHSAVVDYVETGDVVLDARRIQTTDDGFMDAVHPLRDRYAADLVMLLVNRVVGGICGRGNISNPRSPAFTGFAVVGGTCARNGRTFAHELGHNLGGHHDWYNGEAPGAFRYSKGHVSLAGRFVDLMAYPTLCVATGTTCETILAYSNPRLTHNGHRTGVPEGTNTSCTAGNRNNPDCDADVARTFDEIAHVVAGFRDSRLSITARQLLPGASFRSGNGRYRLILQSDGNVVLYDDQAGSAVWATNTGGMTPRELLLQADGNLVLSDAAGCARWASGSGGNTNATIAVNDDGNVVIYSASGQPVWSRHDGGMLLSC